MELFVLGFIFLVPAIALGVWLGTGALRPRNDYSEEYYLNRLGQIGILSKDELSDISTNYNRRKGEKYAFTRLKETVLKLKELDFITEAEMEEKLSQLDQHYAVSKK